MSKGIDQNEISLAVRVSEGSEPAFRQLFDKYKNRIFGYVLAIIHSHSQAEEITQELFIKLWQSRQLLGKVENLDSYLFVMARMRTLSYLKKILKDKDGQREIFAKMNAGLAAGQPDILLEAEYASLLHTAIQNLSPQRKEVYQLSREEDLTMDEIAVRLGLSRNTVKNHLTEALRQIREQLKQHGLGMLLLFIILSE